jgi:hypothetical protein
MRPVPAVGAARRWLETPVQAGTGRYRSGRGQKTAASSGNGTGGRCGAALAGNTGTGGYRPVPVRSGPKNSSEQWERYRRSVRRGAGWKHRYRRVQAGTVQVGAKNSSEQWDRYRRSVPACGKTK